LVGDLRSSISRALRTAACRTELFAAQDREIPAGDAAFRFAPSAHLQHELPRLRVYLAEADAPPIEVMPPPSPRKCWTRRGIAEWLVERLGEPTPTLVGISGAAALDSQRPISIGTQMNQERVACRSRVRSLSRYWAMYATIY
jgi:hypothetical protein